MKLFSLLLPIAGLFTPAPAAKWDRSIEPSDIKELPSNGKPLALIMRLHNGPIPKIGLIVNNMLLGPPQLLNPNMISMLHYSAVDMGLEVLDLTNDSNNIWTG